MQEPQEIWVWSLRQEYILEEEMATIHLFLAGKSQGQWSLVGYIPYSCKELGKTE